MIRTLPGTVQLPLAMNLINLGDVLSFAKHDYDAAAPYFREGLEIRRRVLTPDHPSTREAMTHLGRCLFRMDNCAEAAPVLREFVDLSLPVADQSNPSDRYDIIRSLQFLAECRRMTGDEAGALTTFEEAAEVAARIVGEGDALTMQLRRELEQVRGDPAAKWTVP
jgi:eukaryotic-like serine/threonine-protein kinase